MSQEYTCPGPVATSSGHGPGRVAGDPAPLDELGVFGQDPIHRGDRAQVDALIQQVA